MLMVRSNGLRLVQRLGLCALSSHLLHNSTASLNGAFLTRGYMSFGTAAFRYENRVFNFPNSRKGFLGGTIQVPSLTGDVVVKVCPGTQPGQKVVLKKKGIRARNSYPFGDQYVHFKVNIPGSLTQRLRQLIEEFGKEEEGACNNDAAAVAAAASG